MAPRPEIIESRCVAAGSDRCVIIPRGARTPRRRDGEVDKKKMRERACQGAGDDRHPALTQISSGSGHRSRGV